MSSIQDDDSPPFSGSEDYATDEAAERRAGSDLPQLLNHEDESASDDDRPNRFEGPSSTWLKYTQDERELIRSLKQEEANDLSLHLYNVHGLKARLRNKETVPEIRPWSSKLRWIKQGETGTRPWQPERQWTAWPLHPDNVPRKDEIFGAPVPHLWNEEHTVRKPEMYIPSIDLQGELEALMLEYGKNQFRNREWTQSGPSDSKSIIDMDIKSASATEADDSHATNTEEIDTAPFLSIMNNGFVKPAFSTDDDEASAILQQPVRHIITKLDELLSALHKSRAGHYGPVAGSGSRSRSRSKGASTPVTDGERQRRQSPTGGKPSKNELSEDVDTAHLNPSIGSTHKKRLPSSHTISQCGLRDWSEVLGMASLIGWDEHMIDRAAQRCASLFGESIVFRAMPETANAHPRDELVQYVPDIMALDELSSGEHDAEKFPEESLTDLGDLKQWFCPHNTCARHDTAFEKGFRWREHLRRKHKYSNAEIEQIEETYFSGHVRDRTRSKQPKLAAYPCLVDSCKYYEHPFVVRYRWADHLRRTHRYTEEDIDYAERNLLREQGTVPRDASQGFVRAESSAAAKIDSTVENNDQEENDPLMFGGVHNDGFMEPVIVNIYKRGRGKKRKIFTAEEEEIAGDGEIMVLDE